MSRMQGKDRGGGVVVVIGGAGFLGQHIVRELCLGSDYDEIRVYDINKYEKKLSFEESSKRIVSYVGDVLDSRSLESALQDATAVIHTAAVVDVSVFPDVEKLRRVNVEGTLKVVQACVAARVAYLVFTSTVDVAAGYTDIVNGDEHQGLTDRLVFQWYGSTKREAELIVLAANQKGLPGSDSTLRTLCLRPSCMYGELDPYYITAILHSTKSHHGTLARVGNGSAIFQCMYAGNCAWAHVCALQALHTDPSVSGAAYFINDDTPKKNAFDFAQPFLIPHGFKLSSFRLPYGFIYVLFWIMEMFLKILRPIKQINCQNSLASIIYLNKTYTFKRAMAERRLGYQAKYDYNEALEKSWGFYNGLNYKKTIVL